MAGWYKPRFAAVVPPFVSHNTEDDRFLGMPVANFINSPTSVEMFKVAGLTFPVDTLRVLLRLHPWGMQTPPAPALLDFVREMDAKGKLPDLRREPEVYGAALVRIRDGNPGNAPSLVLSELDLLTKEARGASPTEQQHDTETASLPERDGGASFRSPSSGVVDAVPPVQAGTQEAKSKARGSGELSKDTLLQQTHKAAAFLTNMSSVKVSDFCGPEKEGIGEDGASDGHSSRTDHSDTLPIKKRPRTETSGNSDGVSDGTAHSFAGSSDPKKDDIKPYPILGGSEDSTDTEEEEEFDSDSGEDSEWNGKDENITTLASKKRKRAPLVKRRSSSSRVVVYPPGKTLNSSPVNKRHKQGADASNSNNPKAGKKGKKGGGLTAVPTKGPSLVRCESDGSTAHTTRKQRMANLLEKWHPYQKLIDDRYTKGYNPEDDVPEKMKGMFQVAKDYVDMAPHSDPWKMVMLYWPICDTDALTDQQERFLVNAKDLNTEDPVVQSTDIKFFALFLITRDTLREIQVLVEENRSANIKRKKARKYFQMALESALYPAHLEKESQRLGAYTDTLASKFKTLMRKRAAALRKEIETKGHGNNKGGAESGNAPDASKNTAVIKV
jgi:hypothetical protein